MTGVAVPDEHDFMIVFCNHIPTMDVLGKVFKFMWQILQRVAFQSIRMLQSVAQSLPFL